MARHFGRVLASIWDDEDFRALAPESRLMYIFLLSQPDLDHAGVIPLRERRWGRALALSAEEVSFCLKELTAARFTVMDEDSEELLIRSLIRRDEIWKQPNVFKSASASATGAQSPRIKAALLVEVRRLELGSASRDTHRIRDELVTLLEPFANPSRTPPEGPSTGSGGPDPESGITDETVNTDKSDEGAGQNPSETITEPFERGTSELRGKGSSYGPVPPVSPFPFTFPPPPEGGATVRKLPVRSAAVEAEEGDLEKRRETLITTIRKLRPEWSTESIRRALTAESVAERPWTLVSVAALIVAKDPESKFPGRLEHDGPWWGSASKTAPLPPVEQHAYEPDSNGTCSSCGLRKSNRRHLEAS